MTRKRRILLWSLLLFCCLMLAGSVTWWLAPRWLPDPMGRFSFQTPIRRWLDRDGNLLLLERTWDGQWRDPVPLEKVSPFFLTAVKAAEDLRFEEHHGVDYLSCFRAAKDNLLQGRICSGASTITMQLVSLPEAGQRKTFGQKFIQVLRARRMEQLHSKQEILEEYVNRLPFGGKIYGIQAASIYYFGKNATDLSEAQAVLLAGLPQLPNGYRPDRHPDRAKSRQRRILLQMVKQKVITAAKAEEISSRKLYYRSFKEPSFYGRHAHNDDILWYFFQKRNPQDRRYFLASPDDGPWIRRLTISGFMQSILKRELRRQQAGLRGVGDGAGVIWDNNSGELLAMVGTLDFYADGGQINGTTMKRAVGSTLKPFLFEEALSGGIITWYSKLLDAPLRYGRWTPVNYDGTWQGYVSASEALSLSLNAPAIRLLQKVGHRRFVATLEKQGLRSRDTRNAGLSLILGTAPYSLLELTQAYSRLAGRSTLPPPGRERLVNVPVTGAAVQTARMMRVRHLPDCLWDVAWKTGTSNGLRDAWCMAFTPEYTVGIWFGNKNGRSSPVLVGSTAAAPVAGRVFSRLLRLPPDWSSPSSLFATERICRQSGAPATIFCKNVIQGEVIAGFRCPGCKQCSGGDGPALQIISPVPGQYSRAPVEIFLRANQSVQWYWNYRPLPVGTTRIRCKTGRHVVTAVSGDQIATVKFQVMK